VKKNVRQINKNQMTTIELTISECKTRLYEFELQLGINDAPRLSIVNRNFLRELQERLLAVEQQLELPGTDPTIFSGLNRQKTHESIQARVMRISVALAAPPPSGLVYLVPNDHSKIHDIIPSLKQIVKSYPRVHWVVEDDWDTYPLAIRQCKRDTDHVSEGGSDLGFASGLLYLHLWLIFRWLPEERQMQELHDVKDATVSFLMREKNMKPELATLLIDRPKLDEVYTNALHQAPEEFSFLPESIENTSSDELKRSILPTFITTVVQYLLNMGLIDPSDELIQEYVESAQSVDTHPENVLELFSLIWETNIQAARDTFLVDQISPSAPFPAIVIVGASHVERLQEMLRSADFQVNVV
jgi:hypothetical protein